MVMRAVEKIIDDDRVSEIVVVDDASKLETYFQLQSIFEGAHKVKLMRNEHNLDCYANKKRAVELASNDWAILLDSDNIIDKDYLAAIYAMPEWSSDTIYAPSFAKPHFDYRDFQGYTLTKSNVHQHVGTKTFDCLINTANYFIHRGTYLWNFDPDLNPHAADTIYMNTRHLRSGGKIHVVPEMHYFHDVHAGSHYKANAHKSTGLFEQFRQELNDMV